MVGRSADPGLRRGCADQEAGGQRGRGGAGAGHLCSVLAASELASLGRRPRQLHQVPRGEPLSTCIVICKPLFVRGKLFLRYFFVDPEPATVSPYFKSTI